MENPQIASFSVNSIEAWSSKETLERLEKLRLVAERKNNLFSYLAEEEVYAPESVLGWKYNLHGVREEFYGSIYNSEEYLISGIEALNAQQEIKVLSGKFVQRDEQRTGFLDFLTTENSGGVELSTFKYLLSNLGLDGASEEAKEFFIEQLGNVGGEKALSFLIDFTKNYNNSFVYFLTIITALNKIDALRASREFLNILGSQNRNISVSSAQTIGRMLYRLELGKINISEQGAEYLGKLYDLREYNNTNYFVNRLSTNGDIGVFDESQKLKKLFNLGGLDGEGIISPELHDLTLEMLTTAKADETEDEKLEREKFLDEFKEKYFEFYNDKFFKETGVAFNNLSLKEQGQFLQFSQSSEPERKVRVTNFVKEFGEPGFKMFLYCEYGEHVGDLILEIAESLPKKEAVRVFAEYGMIAHEARRIGEIIKADSKDAPPWVNAISQDMFSGQIYEAIVRRAKDALYTIREISRFGEARADFFNGKEIKIAEIKEPINALTSYRESISKIEGILTVDAASHYEFTLIDHEQGIPESYRFKIKDKVSDKDSYLTMQFRSEGARENNVSREFDGEARINFLFSNDPIELDVSHPSRKNALSIRLDRECKTYDESGKIATNDPTRKDGELSLDLGSLADSLGRTISIGNALSKKFESVDKITDRQYYHNRESFSRDLGDADTFKSIVEVVRKKLESRFK